MVLQSLVIRFGLAFALAHACPAMAREFAAVIGDSMVTGAVAHPALKFGDAALLPVLLGKQLISPEPALFADIAAAGLKIAEWPKIKRLRPLPEDYHGPLNWVVHQASWEFTRRYIDTPEYSWATLFAAHLVGNVPEVLVAAEDGASALTGPAQLRRILMASQGQLPTHTIMMFSAADLCGLGVGTMTSTALYADALTATVKEWQKAAASVQPGKKAVLWLVRPLSLLQIAKSPQLLSRKVEVGGQFQTCKEVQSQPLSLESRFKSALAFMPQSPAEFCPSLFLGAVKDLEAQEAMALRLTAYRQAISQIVKDIGPKLPPSLELRELVAAESWMFNPSDLANDCFHLSTSGHLEFAKRLLAEAHN